MNCKYIGCDNEINPDISEMFCTKHSQEMDAALAKNPKTFMAWAIGHVDMGFYISDEHRDHVRGKTPVKADVATCICPKDILGRRLHYVQGCPVCTWLRR